MDSEPESPPTLARMIQDLSVKLDLLVKENEVFRKRFRDMEVEDSGCKKAFIWLVMEVVRRDIRIRELEDEDDETETLVSEECNECTECTGPCVGPHTN